MSGPLFDIFKGSSDRDAIWMEAVESLSGALDRMEEIAAKSPGEYFVFTVSSHEILARTDTRKALLKFSEPPRRVTNNTNSPTDHPCD